jgi:hypothetical protein
VSATNTCQSRFICEADHYKDIVSSVQGSNRVRGRVNPKGNHNMTDVPESHFTPDELNTDDAILIVLKGHLLIEIHLGLLAEEVFPHLEYLDKARLTFFQLAHVVRASVPERSDDLCWELILKLNSLRNDLAHRLRSPARQSKVAELLDLTSRVQPYAQGILDRSDETSLSDAERLRNSITYCEAFLLNLGSTHRHGAGAK